MGEAASQGADKRRQRSVKKLSDPKALRALAHPIRIELVGQLRVHGQLTATQAAELLGESSASTSFHLRQLAKYGLVEEAGGGQGRERPWRATAMFTSWPEVADDPKVEAAAGLLRDVIMDRYVQDLASWNRALPDEAPEWQEAAAFGDTMLWVTAAELTALNQRVRELVDVYLERQTTPELRPPGARRVTFLHIAHPGVDRARPNDPEG